jgi:putative ABC transport system permease protein
LKNDNLPPQLFLRFFRWFCHPKLRDFIEGDLIELYRERLNGPGKRKADVKFIIDVLMLFRPGIIRPIESHRDLNYYDMYKSYFKITLRNLWTNRGFSFINISGLSVGMTACVLIMLYVLDETSYDKHHRDGHRVYRIASEVKDEKWVAAPGPLAESLKKDFPEVEDVTRLLRFPGTEKMLLKHEPSRKQFFEKNAYYVDSTFFRVFSYTLKFGDIHSALNKPNSIVVSEEVATKFFGNSDPIGNTLRISLSFGEFHYTIQGVFKDTGDKSHIPASLFLSMDNSDIGGWVKMQTNWASNNIFHSYVKLHEGTDAVSFESKLPAFLDRNGGKDFAIAGFTKKLFIQPLKDIYLHSNYGYEVAPNGSIKYLYIFSSIAAFILLIACINFMNLSTARSEKRAREVGMRKVSGATRSVLIGQFLTESLLMSALSLVLAIVLIQLIIPFFNQLTQKELSLFKVPDFYGWLIGLTIATGALSGTYPSFYLSSFMPISVLKGKLVNTISAVSIRKGLVIFQFTISTVLILGAIVISQQMNYLGTQSLGFDKNQKIILPIETNEASTNISTLKHELLNTSHVVEVARASAYPGNESITSMLFYGEGKSAQESVDVHTVFVEAGYIEALRIDILQGRGFSEEFTNDIQAVVLNESAVAQLGYAVNSAIGRNVYYDFQGVANPMKIIGVVKDYHFQSLHQKIKPLVLTVSPFFNGPTSYLIADVKSTDYPVLISELHKAWSKTNPGSPFHYSFLDQDFQRNYENEERTSQLIRYFTIIAIVIACLGLFGLATFTAEQRIKEIGIRKVLGASTSQIVQLLSADFLKLVVVSIVLSIPIGYYLMNGWLHNFAYRIDIAWWTLAASGVCAVIIALVTVGFQAIKAAIANPVKSLKSE